MSNVCWKSLLLAVLTVVFGHAAIWSRVAASEAGPQLVNPVTQPPRPRAANLEIIQERFSDGMVHIEREVTQDAGHNYVNHGNWRQWDRSQNLIGSGQFHMGKPVGVWKKTFARDHAPLLDSEPFVRFEGPFEAHATFRAGVMEGDWTIKDAQKRACCLITLKGGKRHGPTIFWLPNGEVWQEMSYDRGRLDGDVRTRNADGEMVARSTYEKGHQVMMRSTRGSATRRRSEARYRIETLELAEPDDFMSLRFAAYRVAPLNQRHGTWRSWYANGQLQVQGAYQSDRPVGRFVWWHTNGQKAVDGRYRNGQQQGHWVWWHANGQKAAEGNFRSGEQVGDWWSWRPDGRLEQHLVHGPAEKSGNSGLADRRGEAVRLPPVQ